MLLRRNFVAGLCALPIGAPMTAQAHEKSTETLRTGRTPVLPVGPGADEIAADATLNRLTVPVRVNGQGPFDFLVDTAAECSVLSTELAQRLHLQPGPTARLHGIGGVESVETVQLDELTVGRMRSTGLRPLMLPWRRLETDGVLGLDVLNDRCVVLDFNGRTLTVTPSRWQQPGANAARSEATVKGLSRLGRLTFVDCFVDGTRVHAFVDSGAQWSVGNEALAVAIKAFRPVSGEQSAPFPLLGATGQTAMARLGRAGTFTLGAVRFTSIEMMFSNLHVFDVWQLQDRPALLVGVDLLKLFQTVELDFGSSQLRVRSAGAGGMQLAQLG
jgi:predicted aspartyl protease